MTELKPCPFCGSSAEYYETDEAFPLCFIKCLGEKVPCYCQTIVVSKSKNFDPKEKLIEIWNRRVGEDGN